jgi:aryl-alcohol dehydrogenase-like predicted oxidoreductase
MQNLETTNNRQALGNVPLGATGVDVSPMGIGTWAWGDHLTGGYGNAYGEADVQAAFDACIERGVSLFDTAEVYGNGRSELRLGQFARRIEHPIIIATKFFPFPWRLRRSNLIDALRRSLGRLQVEQVDLYQVHWPFPPVPIETWMDAMADAVEAGLVRAYVRSIVMSVDQLLCRGYFLTICFRVMQHLSYCPAETKPLQ